MRELTTPTHTFELDIDASLIKTLKITYSQGDKVVLEKKNQDLTIEGNAATIKLTQEETALFDVLEPVEIQARVLTLANDALASDIIRVGVERVLDDEVLE